MIHDEAGVGLEVALAAIRAVSFAHGECLGRAVEDQCLDFGAVWSGDAHVNGSNPLIFFRLSRLASLRLDHT